MFKVKGINSADLFTEHKAKLMEPLFAITNINHVGDQLKRYEILTPKLFHMKDSLEIKTRPENIVRMHFRREQFNLILMARDEFRLLEMATRVADLVDGMRDNTEVAIELNSGLKALHVTKYQNGAIVAAIDTSDKLYGVTDGVSDRMLQAKVGGVDTRALKHVYSFPYLDTVNVILQNGGVADLVPRA
jgi:hypothetical protein